MSTERGDWSDLDAAVEVGADQAECVWISKPASPTPTERIYQLKHVSGATGTLIATRTETRSDGNIPITLRCSMGRFGEPDLERRILAATDRRLADLTGKDFAPIRD